MREIRVFLVAILSASVGFLSLESRGQDQEKEPRTLGSLKLEFDIERAELLKPQRELEKAYEAQLSEILKNVTKAGDLEKAIAVRNELNGFKEGKSVAAGDDFPVLKRVQTIYAKEVEKRKVAMNRDLVGVVKAHKERLLELQKRLTQENKLDEALEVKAVYDGVKDGTVS